MSDRNRTRMTATVRPRSAASSDVEIDILDDIGIDFWTGEGTTAKTIRDALKGTNPKLITINVNSSGGDAFEGVAIHNILRGHAEKGSRLVANVLGIAASAASIIVAAADEVNVPKNSAVMVHEAWSSARGNASDFERTAALLRQVNTASADTYVDSAKRRGVTKTRDEMLALMSEETWLFGQEAVDAGLADAEIDALEAAASVDVSLFQRSAEMRQRLPKTAPAGGVTENKMDTEVIALKASLDAANAATEQAKAEAAAALKMAEQAEADAKAGEEKLAKLEAERDLLSGNAATLAAELNARTVEGLVGSKLYPAEVASMTKLRAQSLELFDELIAARPALLIATDVTGGDPIANAITADPESKLAALVRDAGKDE